jgi:hypothetical protein
MTARVSEFRFLRTAFVLLLLGLTWVSTSTALAADPAGKVKPYPLNYRIMDGKPLGDHPVAFVYKGQEIKTDDPACKEAFMNNPDVHLKEVQEAAKKHKKAPAKSQG